MLTLYGATFDPRWFAAAREPAETILARFADAEHGGFYETADDHEPLVARRKELEDTPIPSGASSAAFGLLRLAALTGEHRYEAAAEGALRLLHGVAPQYPSAFGHVLQAIDFHLAAGEEVALVGPDAEPLERVVRAAFRPHVVLAGGAADGVPLLEGRDPVDGRAAAYVCERFACQRPVTTPHELAGLLVYVGRTGIAAPLAWVGWRRSRRRSRSSTSTRPSPCPTISRPPVSSAAPSRSRRCSRSSP